MNPYYTEYSDFLSRFFSEKVQKLSIDTGRACPNKDGVHGYGGCIYCRNDAFSPDYGKKYLSISEQIERGKQFFKNKYSKMKYLAYFQSGTPTHGNIQEILAQFREAVQCEDVLGLVIGTRPDCLSDDMLLGLSNIREEGKAVILELGAESSHDETLRIINRGHTWEETVASVRKLNDAGFPVGLHLILGLPGEDEEKIIETVSRVNELPVSTIKFHQLQVLKGTRLHQLLREGRIDIPRYTAFEYAALCARIVRILHRDIAIERFIAQAPSELLVHPRWGLKKYQFDRLLEEALLR